MTLPRKIAALLIALEGGAEIKLKSGHTLAMAENDEPGFKAYSTEDGEVLFQVGSETAYMFLVDHARNITEKEIKELENSFKDDTMKCTCYIPGTNRKHSCLIHD